MIEHVHDRLQRWAAWVIGGRRVSGLGYSRCTLSREVAGGRIDTTPDVEQDCCDTDQAVKELDPKLSEAVQVFYLSRGSVAQKARDVGCSRDTLYERVKSAQARVDDLCSQYAAKRRERSWPVTPVFLRKSA